MVTLRGFVGAVLHGLTSGRIQGDQTSVACAQRYLEDEFLRGFPVPRMTLQNVELEFKFGVAPISPLEACLEQPELRENIVQRLSAALARLPETEGVKEVFDSDSALRKVWADRHDALLETANEILTSKVQSRENLEHRLTLAIENLFYAAHNARRTHGLLDRLTQFWGGPGGEARGAPEIRKWASAEVTEALDSALPPAGDSDSAELPDVNILLGATELEGLDPDRMATTKLTFSRADRRWVASQENGKKVYTLDG